MSSLIKFKYEHKADSEYSSVPEKVIVYQTDAIVLPDIIKDFEYFLKGIGFHFSGELQLVEEDDDSSEVIYNE